MEKSDPAHLISCPNNCEVDKFPLSDMDKHLAECPLELVTCEFADAGCSVKLKRRELKRHMMEKQQEHLVSATLMNLKLTRETIAEKDRQLAEKDRQLAGSSFQLAEKDRQIAELQCQLRTLQQNFMGPTKVALDRFLGLEPHNIVVDGVAKLRDIKLGWQSKPIHSHIGGYRLILCFNMLSNKKGPVMKVFLATSRLCVSPLHADLPATFHITLQLLNQLADGNHFTRTFQLTIKPSSYNVSSTSEAYEFIDYNELYRQDKEIQYLMNDCFKLRMWLQLMLDGQ